MNKLFNFALRKLFPVFDIEKTLTADKVGRLYLNGEMVVAKQKDSLKNQARLLKNTQIWDILTNSLKLQAQMMMFNKSENLQDFMNGKMVLYTISVMENIIKTIEDAK